MLVVVPQLQPHVELEPHLHTGSHVLDYQPAKREHHPFEDQELPDFASEAFEAGDHLDLLMVEKPHLVMLASNQISPSSYSLVDPPILDCYSFRWG